MRLRCNSCDGIYNNSLDVRLTKACDNYCGFCIERQGIEDQGDHVDIMIRNTIGSGRRNVLILGGEPFIAVEKLYHYVKGIRPYVEKIYITTSLPKTLMNITDNKIKYILDHIDGLNVSLQHYSSDINNEVLHASSNHNRIELLSNLINKYALRIENDALQIRVSINLCKGYIDSDYELRAFLGVMKMIGVEHVKINELQSVDKDTYVSFENITGIKLKSPYSTGCQTDVTPYFNIKGLNVYVKRSCFVVQSESTSKFFYQDFIKAILKRLFKIQCNTKVLYEDGTISDGWKVVKTCEN